ncbi:MULTISPECIES: amino acid ABC transporter substrate-binding protein [unclassified Niallia]|uniref:amino acid ABC transporter substrate-binding protein n=1 Tax=unclassified Niallia TaxID=2837522 RepID=UPI001EDAD2DC|nr:MULTISPECIES: amino acid ABC transporter substrate-binding protein [unclassified Niallia]MDL0435193.1 amino acid ABC transporter substrate-binding protein [Niallia sp. SS-2023]UPO87042.1 amino acid ABC transporter substrate-binding protein [Niallia sp. Man26]
MKKFSLLLCLLLSLTIALAACGSNAEKEDSNADSSSENLLEKVKSDGKLVVGTEGTYAPFTFHDEKTGDLTGFDVEIAKEVGKRLGVDVEFKETQWDAIFAGLDAKRFDMIANQVGINDERKEKYLFSDPYISSTAVLVTKSDSDIKSFEDLKGKKSAQSLTSNYAKTAESYGAELVGIDGFNQAVELLNSNRVDATVNDKLSFLDYKKQKPDVDIVIADTADDVAQSGLMFRKGSDSLVDEVNKALQDMIDDGTYTKISEKWFGEDVLK